MAEQENEPEVAVADTNPTDAQEPDEKTFWEDYSPRFEFPISTVSSILIFAVSIALLLFLSKLGMEESTAPIPISMVDGGDDDFGEGMAGQGGEENPLAIGDFAQPTKADFEALPDIEKLPEVKDDMQKKLLLEDPTADTPISDTKAAAYSALNEDLRNKLLGIGSQKGKPGAGSGEGAPGSGDGGRGASSTRARSLRWILTFSTSSGRDYLNQLQVLGATVAIPLPPDNKNMLLFKDLSGNTSGKMATIDDLRMFNGQIQFNDIKRDSVVAIVEALRLDFTPSSFWAFFPKTLEEELARLEKSYNNKSAEDIEETKFRIAVVAGHYKIMVYEQKLKR